MLLLFPPYPAVPNFDFLKKSSLSDDEWLCLDKYIRQRIELICAHEEASNTGLYVQDRIDIAVKISASGQISKNIGSNVFLRSKLWMFISEIVRRDRDKNICQICGLGPAPGIEINLHHIEERMDTPSLWVDASNMITVCKRCHALIHRKRPPYHEKYGNIIKG